MQSVSLAVMCVFMTLGMALAMYGGGSYGYSSYVPYIPQGGSGYGGSGIFMLLLFFLFFILLFNNGNFFNNRVNNTPAINIFQG